MDWVYLSILHSIIVALLILYIRYDNTPYMIFPLIINIIVGILSFTYFIFYYKEHFTNEFVKPKYYIYAVIALCVNVLGYYIIKTCPNPAYFRVFVSLQIILLFLATLYITKEYDVSIQSIMGIIFACLGIILISLDKNNKYDNNR
jgi:drug/metabolite transporter (DMT)-like permease